MVTKYTTILCCCCFLWEYLTFYGQIKSLPFYVFFRLPSNVSHLWQWMKMHISSISIHRERFPLIRNIRLPKNLLWFIKYGVHFHVRRITFCPLGQCNSRYSQCPYNYYHSVGVWENTHWEGSFESVWNLVTVSCWLKGFQSQDQFEVRHRHWIPTESGKYNDVVLCIPTH